jgi:hypothetical protein
MKLMTSCFLCVYITAQTPEVKPVPDPVLIPAEKPQKPYDPTGINFGLGGVIPKGEPFVPLTTAQRKTIFIRDAFINPNIYGRSLIWSIRDTVGNSPEEWGDGPAGFSRRLTSRYARNLISISGRHGLSAWAKYDTRYQRCNCEGWLKRTAHAVSWEFFILNNNGKRVPNWPRIVSTYGAEMLATTWTPGYKWSAQGVQRGTEQFVFGFQTHLIREFMPEIKRAFKRKKKTP